MYNDTDHKKNEKKVSLSTFIVSSQTFIAKQFEKTNKYINKMQMIWSLQKWNTSRLTIFVEKKKSIPEK